MTIMSAIKNHKMTVAMSTAVGGALYALGEFADQGAVIETTRWGSVFGRGLYGAGVGAAVGTGIAISKNTLTLVKYHSSSRWHYRIRSPSIVSQS